MKLEFAGFLQIFHSIFENYIIFSSGIFRILHYVCRPCEDSLGGLLKLHTTSHLPICGRVTKWEKNNLVKAFTRLFFPHLVTLPYRYTTQSIWKSLMHIASLVLWILWYIEKQNNYFLHYKNEVHLWRNTTTLLLISLKKIKYRK